MSLESSDQQKLEASGQTSAQGGGLRVGGSSIGGGINSGGSAIGGGINIGGGAGFGIPRDHMGMYHKLLGMKPHGWELMREHAAQQIGFKPSGMWPKFPMEQNQSQTGHPCPDKQHHHERSQSYWGGIRG